MSCGDLMNQDSKPDGNAQLDRVFAEAYRPHLFKLFKAFRKAPLSAQIQIYSDKLLDLKASPNETSEVVSKLISDCRWLPAVSELKDAYLALYGASKTSELDLSKEKIENEDVRLSQIRAHVLKTWGSEAMAKYVKKWVDEVIGPELFGMSPHSFVKPALFDLEESGYDSSKAIELGKSKSK